ncbi:MAG: hypothetical protein R3D25_17190 [Geminicoccaceae bacterium]
MSEAALMALMAAEPDQVAIAVSGGVDSMTLAYLAHRALPEQVMLFHATSAAVPAEATERVRQHAARHGWRLEIIDAGEVADPRYGSNPPDRCFWCKTNLYAAIAQRTTAMIFSGANLDDLDDYRPGLRAAADHGVRHPWIEVAASKTVIRRIAAEHGLFELAVLPASPCLASRIETGIPVTVGALAAIDEARARDRHHAATTDPALSATADQDRGPTRSRGPGPRRPDGHRLVGPGCDGGPPCQRRGPLRHLSTRQRLPPADRPMTGDVLEDHGRAQRIGLPEAVFCAGKSVAQIARIAEARCDMPSLFTRLSEQQYANLPAGLRERLDYDPISRTAFLWAISASRRQHPR